MNKKKILLMGGTTEALEVCSMLNREGYEYVLSVATEYGRKSALGHAESIRSGRLDVEGLRSYIREDGISVLIDATHPYAKDASLTAIEACKDVGIPYIRYERRSLLDECIGDLDIGNRHIVVESTDEAIEKIREKGYKRIFLGTGSNRLERFCEALLCDENNEGEGLCDNDRLKRELIARVIPSASIIERCIGLGIKPRNIVAMQGPFSRGMNIETLKHYKCDALITKESGHEGGFIEKIEAADAMGIETVIIKRPVIDYPIVAFITDELKIILENIWRDV